MQDFSVCEGNWGSDDMIDEKAHARIERFRARLNRELEELLPQRQLGNDARQPVQFDEQGIGRVHGADQIQVEQAAMAIDRVRKVRIGRIRRALRQMEEAEYGYCITCGNEIAEARLETDPTIHLCSSCAATRAL